MINLILILTCIIIPLYFHCTRRTLEKQQEKETNNPYAKWLPKTRGDLQCIMTNYTFGKNKETVEIYGQIIFPRHNPNQYLRHIEDIIYDTERLQNEFPLYVLFNCSIDPTQKFFKLQSIPPDLRILRQLEIGKKKFHGLFYISALLTTFDLFCLCHDRDSCLNRWLTYYKILIIVYAFRIYLADWFIINYPDLNYQFFNKGIIQIW